MIKNKKLLIDADCPLCKLYGSGFQKLRLIDTGTVTHYQTSAADYCWAVDLDRAKSEIAFVDEKSGKTSYGIDAFIEIVGNKFHVLNRAMTWKPAHYILRKLYRFISFNRKVIAENRMHSDGLSCSPAIHRGYRWSYIILTALFTGFILTRFGNRLYTELGLRSQPYLEYAICLGQIAWQSAAVSLGYRKKLLDYLGNMSTVSLLGAFLLIPVLLIDSLLSLGSIYLIPAFGLVVLIMIRVHISRCRNLGISHRITASWVGYRLLILAAIIYLNFAG